jgi:hypothetical protein
LKGTEARGGEGEGSGTAAEEADAESVAFGEAEGKEAPAFTLAEEDATTGAGVTGEAAIPSPVLTVRAEVELEAGPALRALDGVGSCPIDAAGRLLPSGTVEVTMARPLCFGACLSAFENADDDDVDGTAAAAEEEVEEDACSTEGVGVLMIDTSLAATRSSCMATLWHVAHDGLEAEEEDDGTSRPESDGECEWREEAAELDADGDAMGLLGVDAGAALSVVVGAGSCRYKDAAICNDCMARWSCCVTAAGSGGGKIGLFILSIGVAVDDV